MGQKQFIFILLFVSLIQTNCSIEKLQHYFRSLQQKQVGVIIQNKQLQSQSANRQIQSEFNRTHQIDSQTDSRLKLKPINYQKDLSQFQMDPNGMIKKIIIFEAKPKRHRTQIAQKNISNSVPKIQNKTTTSQLYKQQTVQQSNQSSNDKIQSSSIIVSSPNKSNISTSAISKENLSSNTSNSVLLISNPLQNSTSPLRMPLTIAAAGQGSSRKIVSTEFPNIGLYHEIPSTFALGEIYLFSGQVMSSAGLDLQASAQQSLGQIDYNFVNIVFSEWTGRNGQGGEFRCVEKITMSSLEFNVSCRINSTGYYFISIFAGRYGRSSLRMKTVKDQTRFTGSFEIPTRPVNLSADVINNKLYLMWNSMAAITQVRIYQNNSIREDLNKVYILSNSHTKFQVPLADFTDFNESLTIVEISHANSHDGTYYSVSSEFSSEKSSTSFWAFKHGFDEIAVDLISLQPQFPWKVQVDSQFKFNATFKEDIENEVYIVLPNRSLRKYSFVIAQPYGNPIDKFPINVIRAYTPVSLEIVFSIPGIHIIEVNAATGMALINRPFYVGDGLPLLPDYNDILADTIGTGISYQSQERIEEYLAKTTTKSVIAEPNQSAPIEKKRAYLLQLLNSLRSVHKVAAIEIDDQLTNIAQYHSDDMKAQNYFSHSSPNGDGPSQRAKLFNFTSSIGENIAQSNSLAEAHLGLERSAGHLENSISPDWTRVGIGITTTSIGQYIVVFQFSTRDLRKSPISQTEEASMQLKLVSAIMQKNPNIKQEYKQLSVDIGLWMSTDRKLQIFPFLISRHNYIGPMASSSFVISYSNDWLQRLASSHFLEGYSKYTKVGVSVKVDSGADGLLEIFIVFA